MSGAAHGGGHEKTDFTFKHTIWIIPVSMVLLVAYVVTVWFWSTASLSREMVRKEKQGAAFGKEALHELRAREDSILGGYGWRDDAKTAVRIPVTRAMELLAKEKTAAAPGGME
jgi:hypothetical protein